MTYAWNAETYSQFLNLRTRPSRDLLFAIPHSFQPDTVYDFGCGPGNSTILLKNRWPNAKVVGVDSSPEMLKQAKADYPDICFVEKDFSNFEPTEKIDFIFANASLQWIQDHEILIPRLIQFLSTNGALAIQIPNNFHSPLHQSVISLLKNNEAWKPLLKNLRYGVLSEPLYQVSWYYDLLTKSGLSNLLLWEVEYAQELPDHQALFDWVKGTSLRPILSAMDSSEKELFKKAYINMISKKYIPQYNGKILLPFRRLFMVGFKAFEETAYL